MYERKIIYLAAAIILVQTVFSLWDTKAVCKNLLLFKVVEIIFLRPVLCSCSFEARCSNSQQIKISILNLVTFCYLNYIAIVFQSLCNVSLQFKTVCLCHKVSFLVLHTMMRLIRISISSQNSFLDTNHALLWLGVVGFLQMPNNRVKSIFFRYLKI